MSNHGHGPNFFKIFIVSIGILDVFTAFMAGRCGFSTKDTQAIIDSVLCGAYFGLTVLSFGFGFFVSLVGLENAKRNHKSSIFFYLSILFFFAVLAIFILSKVI